jgi:hypothetical protein
MIDKDANGNGIPTLSSGCSTLQAFSVRRGVVWGGVYGVGNFLFSSFA